MITTKCKQCNKEYQTYKSNGNRRIFCGKECHAQGTRERFLGNSWNKGKQNRLGKKHTEETKMRISESKIGKLTGNLASNWKGGLTKKSKIIRNSAKYRNWRKSIFERDNFTCQICDKTGGDLNADHIKPFSLFPNLRFEINNGRTLCVPCHRKTDTYGFNIINKRTITIS